MRAQSGTITDRGSQNNQPGKRVMNSQLLRILALSAPLAVAVPAAAQQTPAQGTPATPQAAAAAAQRNPVVTEQWEPVPKMVTPGPVVSAPPPGDAIVLFDGRNLDQWVK